MTERRHTIPAQVEAQCGFVAQGIDAGQYDGERCAFLPHDDAIPHSWVPWSVALNWQRENRAARAAGRPLPHPAERARRP